MAARPPLGAARAWIRRQFQRHAAWKMASMMRLLVIVAVSLVFVAVTEGGDPTRPAFR